jgi:protein-tyrosine phosphatase
MLTAGLQPIVTHPERNPLLQKRLPELELWVQRGCLIQVTAQSLLGRFGKSAKSVSEELMRRSLVHFLASDAHDCQHRPPLLDEVWRLTAKQYGEDTARRLLEENPRAALTGAEVSLDEVEIRKKSWFSVFRSKG